MYYGNEEEEIMAYIEVDVDLDEFDDQSLIDELEGRGWWVSPERHWEPLELDNEQKKWICELILKHNLDVTDIMGKEIYNELLHSR